MSYYDEPQRTRRYVREERREERVDPRYAEDPYLRVYESRQLVPRGREDSELSIEEVRRDFPPPGYRADSRRTRSAEPGYYDEYRGYDDRDRYYDRERDYDRRGKKAGSLYYEEEKRSRQRVLNQQEKILAAVAGAALAFGGKELYDRKEAKEHGGDVERNYLTSAALGAAGALAGYQGAEFYSKHKEKDEKNATYVMHRGRDGRVTEYYSDEEGEKEKKGSKSFLENALAASGLGVAVKALTGAGGGHHDDRRSDTRSRRGSPDSRGTARSRSRGPGGEAANKMQKAAMASLIAGATEAFRVAKEPGSWKGEKTKRILTAAAGAATIDAAQSGEKQSKLGLAESVIGGLLGNRVINGSKRNIEEDRRTGRSRSRSRARSDGGGGGPGLAALATAGLGAFGAKKAIENVRSRSRGRSADSYDSRASSRTRDGRRQRSRSRSVVDSARKKLAKIGLGSDPDDRERDRARDDSQYDDRGSRRTVSRKYSDEYDDGYDRGYGRGGRDAYDDDRSSYTSRRRDRSRRRGGKSDASSDSDLGDSDDDEKRAKKMRGKQVITTGLAAVATIHAAHGVYQSMEKRNARQKAVREGRLSPQEAKKLKSKAILQDAASVGIAALGIKGAWSELKEAKELTHECKQFQQEKALRHQRRIERQRRLRGDESGRRSRDDDWYTSSSPRADRYDYGPVYLDSNPYAAGPLPAPPVGYDRR